MPLKPLKNSVAESRRRLRHAMSRSADTGKRPRVTPKEDVCLPLEKNILATPAFDVLVPLSPSGNQNVPAKATKSLIFFDFGRSCA